MSALTTPTSVTLGKSSPLAIICVPSRICTSPALKAASTCSWLPGVRIVSESIRRADVVGERPLDLALQPLGADAAVVQVRRRHAGQAGGHGRSASQVWQIRRCRPLW